jgi:hypothetical protein
MRLLIPIALVAAALILPQGGGASATTRLDVSPKHGHVHSTYVVSFKAEFASSHATQTQYVLGAVNSGSCGRGISSFGRLQSGPYKVGQTVRFVLKAPKSGWCLGVFHGVGHFERKVGDRWTDRRVGRFAFRVLAGS